MGKQLRKLTTDKKKVLENVFDEATLRLIFKLTGQGIFEELQSPIALGKEANVFSAITKEGKVAVKVYRVQNCNFNKMYEYIKSDPRYYDIKKSKRNVIFSWVQREHRNLNIARKGGVRVPLPITFINNVLVQEFIGDELAAPRMTQYMPQDIQKFFDEVIRQMKKLYKAGLVHADLSAFNILVYEDKPYFIDFSQSTPVKNLEASIFLKRDIKNVCNFFEKYGLEVDRKEILKIIRE